MGAGGAERRAGGRQSALLAQYARIKAQHQRSILLFRLGDFYEMFFDDAEVAARTLDLTLTARNRGDPDEVPLCGFPVHAAQPYVARLLAAGHTVAICEQAEAPERGRGLLEREVVRVITPGTILEEESLDPGVPSLLAALVGDGTRFGLGVVDFATGAVRATEAEGWDVARDELERLSPRELLLASDLPPAVAAACTDGRPWATATLPDGAVESTLPPLAARAAGGALAYVDAVYRRRPAHLRPPEAYALAGFLGLDAATRRNLELLQTLAGERRGSLLWVLDETQPPHTRIPGFIRAGSHTEVDALRAAARDAKGWLARFEATERARTGIASLKVRHNRVFGYYVEVTRANLRLVPSDYERRQTLVGAERFITSALKEHESRMLGGEARLRALEMHLFETLLDTVGARHPTLARTADALATLDCLAALADVAHRRGWVRPAVTRAPTLAIRAGRHPVVEAIAGGGFVPNDVRLDPEEEQIVVLTGPNMGGKSTYLRQTALITLLAQMRSFVPAAEAATGLVDRIFTRVGASDNLAGGESTFMVEMRETAHILAHLTPRSLVILDEIGRGTSTFDGISIAWAVVEHLHEAPERPRTLFATHYHELTSLTAERARVRNQSVAVAEWKGEIVFLRQIVAGPAPRSYGLEVARLAGVPGTVVARARALRRARGRRWPYRPPPGSCPRAALPVRRARRAAEAGAGDPPAPAPH